MATMNVSLPNPMKDWIEEQVGKGQHANVSDYVRDLVRRDQESKEKKEMLIQALIEGEKSGISKQTLDDIWKGVKSRYRNAKV